MTMPFIAVAALMLIAALTFVLRPLLRGRRPDSTAATAERRLRVLQEAHAAGVLDDAEYAAKRAALAAEAPAAPDARPVRTRAAFNAAIAVAFVVPIAAIVLYRVVGDPRALDPASIPPPAAAAGDEHGGQGMDQAIASLAAKLKQNPNDAEGWALLGRAYLETQHFPEARDALKHAHELATGDPDVAVAYAEAMTLAGESHRLEGEARALIEAALKTDPKNQRGLWLLGIADYQDRKFDDAIARWNELLAQLPKDAPVAASVKNQIARAEAERDGREPPPQIAAAGSGGGETDAGSGMPATSAPAANAGTTPGAAAAATGSAMQAAGNGAAGGTGAKLTVEVKLDPKLQAQVAPGDTLFVYAKAASGPPMPLAIQRLTASQLPATVVLTDGMGMLPSMKLSQFPQVIVGARISKSGNAIAQSGDLQTVSKPLDVAATAPIALTIDQRVP